MVDSSSDDDDIPLGQLKNAAAPKPDAAVSSSSSRPKKGAKKRPNYKEESENEFDADHDFAPSPPPKKKKTKKGSTAASTNGGSSSANEKNKDKPKKKVTAIKKERDGGRSKQPKPSKKSPTKKSTTTTHKALKQLDKSERISHAMQAYLWWNAEDPPKGCQWVKMEHAGVSFPEGYVPHGVKMRYDGKEVDLTPLEEEA